jgi:predicted ATPase
MAALEALGGLRVTEHVERLAHHALRGEVWDKALAYAWQAAIKAVARSAHAEALSSLTTALDLLSALPKTPARAQQELDIQTTLGPVLMALKGFTAPEVEQAYARARVLCQQVGDTPQLFPVLHGLWRFYVNRSVFPTARELGEELLTSARQHGAPALLVEAHRVLGQTLFWRGEIIASHTHMEQGIVLYDAQQHGAHTQLYGQDPGVVCQAFAAWTLWLLGYPDQAQQRIGAALTLAQERAHPFSLAYAPTCAAIVARFRRDAAAAFTWAEAVRALAREQGFPFWWT